MTASVILYSDWTTDGVARNGIVYYYLLNIIL